MPRVTPGPTFTADITPPQLGVPSTCERPAVTDGDASPHHSFSGRASAQTHRYTGQLFGRRFFVIEFIYLLFNQNATMAEESRGKRRKQANPRRNRGKKQAALRSFWKLLNDGGRCRISGRELSCVRFLL